MKPVRWLARARRRACIIGAGLAGLLVATRASAARPANPLLPGPPPSTIYIAGDSTAADHSGYAIGWGRYLGDFFDPSQIKVVNRAIGGRSSRTYISDGAWDRLLADVKPGDTVLLQFGQNDGAAINGARIARGSLPGLGEETRAIHNRVTHRDEVVHTFGWYVRKMIADVRGRGAMPVVLSLTARNLWRNGRIERGSGHYSQWNREIARAEQTRFVDVTDLLADRYEQMGRERAKAFFPRDPVHTNEAGARFVARIILGGIKGLRENALDAGLSPAGREVPTAPPTAVWVPPQPPPRGRDRAAFLRWLNLPDVADRSLPTVFLIGDSTVRNGRGNGYDGQFGWGDPFASYFDPAKVNVVNRAVGGTGARTFLTSGYWDEVLVRLKPGDVVIMQFGHNDNGRWGALKGTGDETEVQENPWTKKKEIVHTFGWYLRKYIAETRAKGATPVVCSLVPRKIWRDGKIVRNRATHAGWAKAAAKAEGADFIDLNELVAERYDALGPKAVDPLFADRGVHTSWAGAKLIASVVIGGLKALPKDPVAAWLR